MLVLTRVEEEQIIISDDITLTIVSVKGNRVRIGDYTPVIPPKNQGSFK